MQLSFRNALFELWLVAYKGGSDFEDGHHQKQLCSFHIQQLRIVGRVLCVTNAKNKQPKRPAFHETQCQQQ